MDYLIYKLNCVASISVRFLSEERRWRVDQRPLGLGLSLLRNHTKTLATQDKRNKGKLQRLIARHLASNVYSSVSNEKKYGSWFVTSSIHFALSRKKAFTFENNHIFRNSKLNFHFPLVIFDPVLS